MESDKDTFHTKKIHSVVARPLTRKVVASASMEGTSYLFKGLAITENKLVNLKLR